MAIHWVARARYPAFVERDVCREVWSGLRALSPRAAGASLMPTHLHLVDPGNDDLATPLRRLLSGLAPEWEVSATDIPNGDHLARRVRYVHLNPCRDELCRDPLEWEWSTHRDYLGAAVDPWPPVAAMLRRFGYRDAAAFHAYVSGDPSVHPLGTPPPAAPLKPALIDLAAFERAAVLATRLPDDAFRRKGRARARLMQLLVSFCGVDAPTVAAHFRVSPGAPRPTTRLEDPWLKPILLTMNDARLRGK